jgi:hypothetical protein
MVWLLFHFSSPASAPDLRAQQAQVLPKEPLKKCFSSTDPVILIAPPSSPCKRINLANLSISRRELGGGPVDA